MIEIKNLTKRYGEKCAVDDISFTVNQGEVLGFLGPNGAGKSTTMNILTGYISYTEGQVTVDGFDVAEHPMECKRKIGYLPEQPPLYLDMTVSEYLNFVYEAKGVKDNRTAHLDAVMTLVRIKNVQGRLIKNLSKGYRQRVGIAQALVGNPEILILDEPTVGLDPKQMIEIRNLIKGLGKNRTVILSSHILSEVSAICERVVIIDHGKIMAVDTPENLSRRLKGDSKSLIRVDGDKGSVLNILRGISGVTQVDELGQKEEGTYDFLIDCEDGADVRRDIFRALSAADMPILLLKPQDLSLEDVFLKLTDETADAATALESASQEAGQAEANDTEDKGGEEA